MNVMRSVAFLAAVLAAGACGSNPANRTRPRVFFVEPRDGANVKSPVHLKFGLENYQLAPVPQGTVDSSRAGIGHHHIGVDQDCLATGITIVKGTPSWIHFGDGKTDMDLQLTPGRHKLTLQLGDDQHKTIEGLCQTITVNVAP